MLVGFNVLESLNNSSISLSRREELAEKMHGQLVMEIKHLKAENIVRYLFNSKLPKKVKKIIADEVEWLSSSDSAYASDKIKKIKTIFRSNVTIYDSLLDVIYCPNILKEIVIDEVYKDDIVDLLCKKTLSLKRKKTIVDLRLSKADSIRLLERNVSEDLKNYVIERRVNDDETINKCLLNDKISEDVRKRIVVTKIDMSNIFRITRSVPFSVQSFVFKLKEKEKDDYIDSLTSDNVLDIVNDYIYPVNFVDEVIKRRRDILEQAILKASQKQLFRTIRVERDQKLVNLVLDRRKDDLLEIFRNLEIREILNVLNRVYLPNEIKDYIMDYHKQYIDREIKKHNISGVELFYLKKDNCLPHVVAQKLFEEYKKDFVEKFNRLSSSQVIDEISYGNYCDLLLNLLIDTRIDETNIFNLLGTYNLDEAIVGKIFDSKKHIFREYLEKINIDDLIYLNRINIPKEIKIRILDENIDTIINRLAELESRGLLEILKDSSVLLPVKKVIMEESYGMREVDLANCLDILSSGSAELLVKNYQKIKELMATINIDFNSFLQYGSGSQKYNNWLINLTDIINSEYLDEFIKAKHYFFKEYYSEYLEKENDVLEVANFLELTVNFFKYYDLIMNLVNNDCSLSEEDKMSILFLFSTEKVEGVAVPTKLEEVSAYKQKLYEGILDRITSNNLTIDEIKNIFNDLVFGNSDELVQNIGGSCALKLLKHDNRDSVKIGKYIDGLILYTRVIEMVNDTNDFEGLKDLAEFVFSDIETLTLFQNIFFEFERKIGKLYEADSKYHLTSLSKVKTLDKVLDYERMTKYGGEVYDFSDKNYVLYAHVLGKNEKVADLFDGHSNGKNNFISVSPVTYMGQKYYWDLGFMIFAYDNILNGSFVCSSIYNMNTNYKIKNNSAEVGMVSKMQRGILETSAVNEVNSEALLFREGLKPCGLILPGGREPYPAELDVHKKYGIPFIITQEIGKAIDNVKMVFENNDAAIGNLECNYQQELLDIINILEPNVNLNKETDIYTGREIGLFTDSHSMYEPTLAVLEDMKKNGIDEIYSLGDNVGLGPNPIEVFDLLEEYGVMSVAGNSEYYNILGTEPFTYFHDEKKKSQEWTRDKLGNARIKKLRLYPASIDLIVGGKKLALCHFANDVRYDYYDYGTQVYQRNYSMDNEASKQFLYTNSEEAKRKIDLALLNSKNGDKKVYGYASAKKEPLFGGKRVTDYDAVIQGHVHFDITDKLENTDIQTIRAVGIGYGEDSNDTACYYVLKEKKSGGYDLEKRLVRFNKNRLISDIYTSGVPNREHVLKFVNSGVKKS